MSLSDDTQADIIDAFNTTSRYCDDILNINNIHFEIMISQYALHSFNLIHSQFWTCNCPFLMILFLHKFTIYVTRGLRPDVMAVVEHMGLNC